MADESVHELSAAYALDALDERERAEFEAHLAGCEECRAGLAGFSETAAALAYAPETLPPPAALRGRILAAAAERSNVVPLRRRRPVQAIAAAAAVAAGLAIGFGVWASSLNERLQREQDVSAARAAALHIVGAAGTRVSAVKGPHRGTLAVASDGRAVLMLGAMPPPPAGHVYEAWVIAQQRRPQPAGLFSGGSDTMLALQRPVPRNALVAVTIERSGGADAPTRAPMLVAQA